MKKSRVVIEISSLLVSDDKLLDIQKQACGERNRSSFVYSSDKKSIEMCAATNQVRFLAAILKFELAHLARHHWRIGFTSSYYSQKECPEYPGEYPRFGLTRRVL